MAPLPKPVLRGFLARNIRFHLIGATLFSCSGGLLMKIFYADPRKRRHDEFYATYDAHQHLMELNEAGIMQSGPNYKG